MFYFEGKFSAVDMLLNRIEAIGGFELDIEGEA